MTSLEKTAKVLTDREKGVAPPPLSEEIEFWREFRQGLLSVNAVVERRIEKLKQK